MVQRGNEHGLSFVEVLVSLAVLSFIALSVMTMVTTAVHLNKLSEERSIATALAAERIQQMKALDYQSAANYTNYSVPGETAAALERGAESVEGTIDGKPWVQKPFPYQGKCLAWLREAMPPPLSQPPMTHQSWRAIPDELVRLGRETQLLSCWQP